MVEKKSRKTCSRIFFVFNHIGTGDLTKKKKFQFTDFASHSPNPDFNETDYLDNSQ